MDLIFDSMSGHILPNRGIHKLGVEEVLARPKGEAAHVNAGKMPASWLVGEP